MAIKIIIDTDPGVDDAIALIAALTSPDIDVVGVTSIGGNVPAAVTQKNALGICALVGRSDVPVYAGLDRALVKQKMDTAEEVHGADGVHGLVLPDIVVKPASVDAVDFLLSETRKTPDITLVVIGPMTNVATAYLRDNTLPTRVKEIVAMSGAFGNPSGNVTPYAEFNVISDPHAAKIVYDNFPRIRVFPLDTTHMTMQDSAFRDGLRARGITGQNIANMLDSHAATYPGMEGTGRSPLHDFHTIAALVKPDMYEMRCGRVSVTEEGEREGQTVFVADASGNASVAFSVKADAFFECLRSMLSVAGAAG